MEKHRGIWEKYGYQIIYISSIILIAVLGMWNIDIQSGPRSFDDEFGYWGVAAHLAGLDWSDLLSNTAYYSYGYSFVLMPIYFMEKLGMSTAMMYKSAIALNGIFLILSFQLSVYVGKRILPTLNRYYLLCAALVANLYISNFVYAGYAKAETYLQLMFWCVIACMLRIVEDMKISNILLLLFATANLFAVHMRSIGIVLAVAGVLTLKILLEHKKINKKQIIFILAAACVLICAVLAMRGYVTNVIYDNNAKLATNEFSGQLSKIRLFFSISGLVDIFLSALGKLFYMGTASYMITFIGLAIILMWLLKIIKKGIKSRKIVLKGYDYIMLFLGLSFFMEIMVSAIFKTSMYYSQGEVAKHTDSVIFGRYTDFIAGPFLLIGFSIFPKIKEYLKEIAVSVLMLAVCTIAVQHQYNIRLSISDVQRDMRNSVISGMAYMFSGELINFAYFAFTITMVVFIIIFIVNLSGGDGRKESMLNATISLLIVGVVWSLLGVKASEDTLLDVAYNKKTVVSVADLIQEIDADIPVYCIWGGNDGLINLKNLQWMYPERKINLVTLEEVYGEDGKLNKEGIFLSESHNHKQVAAISDVKNYIYDSGGICVYTDPGSNTEKKLVKAVAGAYESVNTKPVKIDLSKALTLLSYQKYNGNIYFNYNKNEGYLTDGMGVFLKDGIYEFVIDITISDYDGMDEIGYIMVTNREKTYQEKRLLTAEDFSARGRGKVKVQAKIENYQEPVIGVYTYANCAMKICDIEYYQVKGNVLAGEYTKESFERFGEIINLFYDQYSYPICYVDSDSSAVNGWPDFSEVNPLFPEGIKEYIPGQIIPYKENLSERYLILENTDKNQTLFELLKNYMVISKNQDYTLLVPNTKEMKEKAKKEGLDILAVGNEVIDIGYFNNEYSKNISYSDMRPFQLPKGYYEVYVDLTVKEGENPDIATFYLNGKENKINDRMLSNNKYEGVYDIYVSDTSDDIKIGLFINSKVMTAEESIKIKRINDNYESISLHEAICINATCFQETIITDIEKESQIIIPDISLNYGEYELRIMGQYEGGRATKDAYVKVLRNDEFREEIPMVLEGKEQGDSIFTYMINEYEYGTWQFVICSEGDNIVKIDSVEVIRKKIE